MKCAVAIVLALFGVVAANPVGWGGLGPVVLPSAVSYSSSIVNHGLSLPIVKPIISVPLVKPIISAPIITAPIIRTPIITAPILRSPIVSAPVGLGWGGLGGVGGLGWGGLGWNSGLGLGKGWH